MAKKHRSIINTQFITACLSTTLVLVLLGTIVLFVLSAHNLSNYVRENINVSILISDELDELQMANFEHLLDKLSYIKEKKFISKEEALKEECEEMGTDPTEFLGYNPFTASYEIKVKAQYATNERMAKIVKDLKAHPAVVDIIYHKDLIKAVNDNIRKISIVLLILAALFTYISFALINNIVRLTIFSKRFIINTMKLVGASWGFIRRPFMYSGVTMGLISALLADAALFAGIYWLNRFEPQLSLIVDTQVITIVGTSVLCSGIAITLLCLLASLNRYLRMNSNELYYI
ncbi:MAG: permease-like cell division protein FtsX [Bacteroidaceae bacterium]|nr:permease-like cell division protein FtsX [Bacteroidaceae bacterium]